MIDRYLVRYFLAVIDCGNFSKAARQANVSQPTLSIGIHKLERLLGAVLFERTNKRVHLTGAGTRFATHARRIEAEFNIAAAEVLALKPSRALRLGVISSFPMERVAAAVRDAGSRGPSEQLQIVPGNERELLQRLTRGQIDVGLTILRPEADEFTRESLMSEPYALALHDAHPLAGRSSIKAEELADETMIVRRHCEVLSETSRHFTERGVRPFFAFRSTNDEQVLAFVRAGLGLTVMPACYAAKGVARPKLAGFNFKRELGFLFAGHVEPRNLDQLPLLKSLRSACAR